MSDDSKILRWTELTETFRGSPSPDGKIGNYRLLQKIGEGGMGEVWEAEQEEPVRRRVALKLIKWGMDTKSVIARFEAERQALALMNHPNVAKVLDAGALEQGRPYFVMELVKGVPITKHCDKQRLTTKGRLELFMQACQGVQHAHQKGLIHRDIKPSNILVSIEDTKPIAKIIDFGVAKAVQQRLTEKTVFTQLGQLVGTPEYMSPEQAEMTLQDIDTRTDVYSLGVVLYELLVGVRPFDISGLRRAGFDEFRRRIRDDEPSKPSSRLSTLGGASAESAKRRRTNLRALQGELSGDLDWITMKALEKDPGRRYSTARDLEMDLQRFFNREPVLASPPSKTYRAKKFVIRHRVGVAAAGLSGLAMLSGLALATVGFVKANRERDRAIAAEARSRQEAVKANAVNDFLHDILTSADPSRAKGRELTVREIVDLAAANIAGKFENQPLVDASIRTTLGRTYRGLGAFEPAEKLLKDTLDLRQSELGSDDPKTLDAVQDLAVLAWLRGHYLEAESLHRETLEKRLRIQGGTHEDTLSSMNDLALVYRAQGKYDEAERLFAELLEIRRRTLGKDHLSTLTSMHNLALVYTSQGRFDLAKPLSDECLAIKLRVLGESHPDTLKLMSNLAYLHARSGEYRKAVELFKRALNLERRVFGERHGSTLLTMTGLAYTYVRLGEPDKAEPLFHRCLEVSRSALGEEHPTTLQAMDGLSQVYRISGRYDEAEALLRETWNTKRRVLGEEHPDTLQAMAGIGGLLVIGESYESAELLLTQTIALQKQVFGPEHEETLKTMIKLATVLTNTSRESEASELLDVTVAAATRSLPAGHPVTGIALTKQGQYLTRAEAFESASAALLRSYELLSAAVGPEHYTTVEAVQSIVELYQRQGQTEAAASWQAKLPGGVDQTP